MSLLRSIPDHQSIVQLSSIVERVKWRRGLVEVQYKSALDNKEAELRCRQLVVTVPLGVLQTTPPSPGAIRFEPEPGETLEAAGSLKFGDAYRVTFRFEDAFWEENEKFQRIGFLISTEKLFPTWWTTQPVVSPLLTGWTAGSAADELRGSDGPAVAAKALHSLARILGRKVPQPKDVYFHDWHTDPFFRGAYSYVPVNALPAREAVSKPVEGTLFFAGEATDTGGHGGTVHGAIASGVRAAEQVQAENARGSRRDRLAHRPLL
jgi:monoamine oxidase